MSNGSRMWVIGTDLTYDEVIIGEAGRSARHEVTAQDIAVFADVTRDRHPLHLDRDHALSFGYPDVIAHGLLGLSLMEGLKSEMRLYQNTSIASLGWDKIRFLAPVFVGDQLHVRVWFISKRLSSKPGRGVVVEALELVDDQGGARITAEHTTLLVTCKNV